jgi:hypothetical protein
MAFTERWLAGRDVAPGELEDEDTQFVVRD